MYTGSAVRVFGVVTVLVVLTVVAACGGDGSPAAPSPSAGAPPSIPVGAPATPPSSSAVPDPLTGTPPDGTTPVPAAQVDTTGLPAGFPTLVWTRGPRTLGVYARAGGCTAARAEVVDQTADHVTLRVVQYSTGPGPCTRELRYPALEVPLAADLGTRRVVLLGVAA